MRARRVSAPDPPPVVRSPTAPVLPLEDIDETSNVASGGGAGFGAYGVSMEGGMPMSYSADDMQQLMEDADNIGPSKWKKFGLAAG